MAFFFPLISKFCTLFLDIFNYVSDVFALSVFLNLRFTRSPWSDQHRNAKEDSGPQASKPRPSLRGWQGAGRPGDRQGHAFDHTVGFLELLLGCGDRVVSSTRRYNQTKHGVYHSFSQRESRSILRKCYVSNCTQIGEQHAQDMADIFLTFSLSVFSTSHVYVLLSAEDTDFCSRVV